MFWQTKCAFWYKCTLDGKIPAEIYKVLKYISEFLLQCLIFYLAINYAYIKQYREQHIIVNQGIDDFFVHTFVARITTILGRTISRSILTRQQARNESESSG